MIADIEIATARAALTTRALSTLGAACPEWDRAVRELLRAQALTASSDMFGPYSKASEKFGWAKAGIEAEYGHNWRENAEAKASMDAARAEMREAEERHAEDYLRPLWAAQRKVVTTPAPNLNAALYKAELMGWDEVWNDCQLERDGFAIVAEELARFAGEA